MTLVRGWTEFWVVWDQFGIFFNITLLTNNKSQGHVQPRQNGANRLLNGNGGALNTVLVTQVLQLRQLRRSFFVFFLENFRSLLKSV